ncbi:hypothetical protein LF817_13895 [Halobacillus sp. A1]|uniref:hypothetical protein n=1 Tax=Halobacillus sp. A1 TaxID=2880262 RepID=UPI0020A68E1D|nr:hypothetical protein [Halobacillus sp. A1]MCP3032415.1 hypothetical protein [Halobacillus sp. A1]
MVLAYIVPFVLLACFFLSILFLMEGLAKLFLMLYLVLILFLPFILIYKEDTADQRNDAPKKSK